MNTQQPKEIVTLSLPKEYVSNLLGALRLGIWLENWCADLCMTEISAFDSGSWRWSNNILHIIDLIKERTGVRDEFKSYGEASGWLDEMSDWVNRQCNENLKTCEKYENTPVVTTANKVCHEEAYKL